MPGASLDFQVWHIAAPDVCDGTSAHTTPGVARSVLADCLFRTHAHVLVWSIQYWPTVRYCGMNCPTDRQVPRTMISRLD